MTVEKLNKFEARVSVDMAVFRTVYAEKMTKKVFVPMARILLPT